jgi:hypothetical protein
LGLIRDEKALHAVSGHSTPTRRYCPVPVNVMVCGLVGSASLMVTAAVRLPIAVGLKVTLIVQLAPAARLVPQLFV